MRPKKKNEPANIDADSKEKKKLWWFKEQNPIDRFTGWLVAWTFLLFLATLGLGVVAYWQWGELAKTDGHIADQLAELKTEQRPWIAVNPEVEFAIGRPLVLFLQYKNVGYKPAFHVHVIAQSYVGPQVPDAFSTIPPVFVAKQGNGSTLMQSTSMDYKFEIHETSLIDQKFSDDIDSSHQKIGIVARIEYTDGDGKPHFTNCRAEYSRYLGRFISLNPGNEAE